MAGLPAVGGPAGAPAGADAAQTALYFSTAAELAHAYEHTLASDQEALSDDQAAYRANQGKLNAAEPLDMTKVRDQANAEGLATSGIEGQRADTQQASFTRSLGALATTRQQDTDKINRGMEEAGESYADKMKTNLADRETEVQKEAQANAEKNPTLGSTAALPGMAPTNPATPVNPGGVKTVTGPAGPGGVVPYSESSNAGFVRVGPAKPVSPTVAVRKAAAKKVVG